MVSVTTHICNYVCVFIYKVKYSYIYGMKYHCDK